MIAIEHIQKMLVLFEDSKRLVTIKGDKYDVLLEPLPDINIQSINPNRCLLTLRAKNNVDAHYILSKISLYKYSNYNVSYYNNYLQISYIIDNNKLTNDMIINNIALMEQLI